MDKEDFKDRMKDIFDEAQEEFNKQEIRIPHPIVHYECPSCCSKSQFGTNNYPMFKCKKCGAEARLEFILIKKGKEED